MASVAVAECGRWGRPPAPTSQVAALRSRDGHLGSLERKKPGCWALGSGAFHRTSDTHVLPRGRENPIKIWLLLRLESYHFLCVVGAGFFGKGVTLNIGTSSCQSATHFLLFVLG